MKRYAILALALVLGCTVFTGCRRRDGHMETMPHVTQPPTAAVTEPVTRPATEPVTEPVVTMPTGEGDVTDPSNQDATDGGMTDSTEASAPQSRAYRPDGR